MAADLSGMTTADLQALKGGDLGKVSTAGLQQLKGMKSGGGGTAGAPASVGKAPEKPADMPFKQRTIMAAMDNDAERQAYVEKEYGKGSKYESKGRLVTTASGKKMSGDPGFWASMASEAPETVLGIVGGAQGAVVGSLGGPIGTFAGAVGGAALGAAGGKAVKEEAKRFTGTQKKTGEQITASLTGAAEGGAIGEVTGQGIGKAIGRLTRGPLPAWLSGATKDTKQMTNRLLDKGAIPPAQSTMPDAKKLQRVVILADKLSGPSAKVDRANSGYLQDRAGEILDKAGVPKAAKADAMGRLSGSTTALSSQETGQLIQKSAQGMTLSAPAGIPLKRAAQYQKQLASMSKSPEGAYNYLVHGGQTDRLEWFVHNAGTGSPPVQAIRSQALRHVLAGSMERGSTGESLSSIDKELAKFTQKQQKLLFPSGQLDDLRLLSREIKFLNPGDKDPAMASLTAGAIQQRNFVRRWKAVAQYAVGRALLQNPAVIRRLAVGFRGGTASRKSAQLALSEMAHFGAQEMMAPQEDPSGGQQPQ